MLEELINKVQEVFFASPEEKTDWLVYYPSYVKLLHLSEFCAGGAKTWTDAELTLFRERSSNWCHSVKFLWLRTTQLGVQCY